MKPSPRLARICRCCASRIRSGDRGPPPRLRSPGAPGGPWPLLPTTVTEENGEVSPDGRWLAYQSNEGGHFQVSVRPFPNVKSGHWPITTSGGTRPLWAGDGRGRFFFGR